MPVQYRQRLYCECESTTCWNHRGPCKNVGRFYHRTRTDRAPDSLVLCKTCRDNRGQAKETE